jgi:hypothetical protein
MKRPRRSWLCWLFVATAPAWLFPLGWAAAFSSNAFVSEAGHLLIQAPLVYVAGFLGAAGLLVLCVPALFVDGWRGWWLRGAAVAAAGVGGCVVGEVSAGGVRRAGLARVAERSRPLVAAIEAYAAEHGRPPPSLDALVPGYIGHIPATGIGARPQFRYFTRGTAATYKNNEWMLSATPPTVVMAFDTFVYLPRQNYGDAGFSRIGAWGYLCD